MDENIYRENGYADRNDYLNCLSEDYGVSIEDVYDLAEILGENEDFDGLVVLLKGGIYELDIKRFNLCTLFLWQMSVRNIKKSVS